MPDKPRNIALFLARNWKDVSGFAVFGLLLAGIYLQITTSDNYRVTMVVPLNKVAYPANTNAIIGKDSLNKSSAKYKLQQIYLLLSTSSVEDAVKRVTPQTAYFRRHLFFSEEIFRWDVPFKVTLINNNLKTEMTFVIQELDGNFFVLKTNGKNYLYYYGQHITFHECEFFVSKATGSANAEQPVTVRIRNLQFLSQQIISSIDLRPANADTSSVILTTFTTNPQKTYAVFSQLKKNYLENNPEKRAIKITLDGINEQIDTIMYHFSLLKMSRPNGHQAGKIKFENQASFKLYMSLLQKRQDLMALLLSLEKPLVRPHIEVVSGRENVVWVLLSGLIAGMILPLSYLYIKSLVLAYNTSDRKFSINSDIPVLGEIKYINTLKKVILPVGADTIGGKQILEIEQKIIALSPNKVIAVLSMNSGEGKSFFCNNLGTALAFDNKMVIIIQIGKHNDKCELIDQSDQPGLNNYLQDSSVLSNKIIRPTHLEKLFVMPPGNTELTASEAIHHPKMHALLGVLRNRYDHIILDTNFQAGESIGAFKILRADLFTLVVPNQSSVLRNGKHIGDYINKLLDEKVYLVINNLVD